jgi:hypothetical protein
VLALSFGASLCAAGYAAGLWLLARRQVLVHLAIARRALWRPRGGRGLAAVVGVAPIAERTRAGG